TLSFMRGNEIFKRSSINTYVRLTSDSQSRSSLRNGWRLAPSLRRLRPSTKPRWHKYQCQQHQRTEQQIHHREKPLREAVEAQPIEQMTDNAPAYDLPLPSTRSRFSRVVSGQDTPISASRQTSRIVARCATRKYRLRTHLQPIALPSTIVVK